MLSYSGDVVLQNTSVCEHSFKNGNHLVNIPFFFFFILGTSPKAFTSTTDLN